MTKEFVVYCIAINIIALVTMVYDKIAAIRRDWRVSEQTLLILAVIGGVFGIWIGMTWPMYHKASKQKFRLGIPCIALVWILLLIK